MNRLTSVTYTRKPQGEIMYLQTCGPSGGSDLPVHVLNVRSVFVEESLDHCLSSKDWHLTAQMKAHFLNWLILINPFTLEFLKLTLPSLNLDTSIVADRDLNKKSIIDWQSVDPDYEPSHLNLHCLQRNLEGWKGESVTQLQKYLFELLFYNLLKLLGSSQAGQLTYSILNWAGLVI